MGACAAMKCLKEASLENPGASSPEPVWGALKTQRNFSLPVYQMKKNF